MKKVETENMYAMFGTPLYSNFFPRDFNELEKKTLLNLEFRNNEGNYTSIDNFVLNRIELAEIKNFIETSLIECFNTVYSPPPNTCEIYLTQYIKHRLMLRKITNHNCWIFRNKFKCKPILI